MVSANLFKDGELVPKFKLFLLEKQKIMHMLFTLATHQ